MPLGLVSVDGLARASRGGEPVARALLWALGRSVPLLAVLLLAYLLSLLGLVPRPPFPFDPQSHPFGIGPALALLALAAAFVAALVAGQRFGSRARRRRGAARRRSGSSSSPPAPRSGW